MTFDFIGNWALEAIDINYQCAYITYNGKFYKYTSPYFLEENLFKKNTLRFRFEITTEKVLMRGIENGLFIKKNAYFFDKETLSAYTVAEFLKEREKQRTKDLAKKREIDSWLERKENLAVVSGFTQTLTYTVNTSTIHY